MCAFVKKKKPTKKKPRLHMMNIVTVYKKCLLLLKTSYMATVLGLLGPEVLQMLYKEYLKQ